MIAELRLDGKVHRVTNKVTAKLKTLEPAGVNHMILAITDAGLVKAFTGREIHGVADVNTQIRLVAEQVMPAFA